MFSNLINGTRNTWANMRVETLKVDRDLIVCGDLDATINPNNIEPGLNGQVITTVNGISEWANPGGIGGDNIYNTDGALSDDRTIEFDNNVLRLDNTGDIILIEELTLNRNNVIYLTRNDLTGEIQGKAESDIDISGNNILSTGNVGVFYDNGVNVSVTNNPNIGNVLVTSLNSSGPLVGDNITGTSISTQDLESNNLTLTIEPTIENSNTDLLSRNSVSGEVEIVESGTLNIPVLNLVSSGSSGVLFDNGTSIVQTFHPTLGNLISSSLTLNTIPNVDNTETDIIVRDSVTGEFEIRQVSSLPFTSDTSIYNTNASLTGDRIVNCNSNDITFSNNDNFTVGEFAASSTYFTIADNNLFATGYPGIDLSHRDSSNDPAFSTPV